MPNKQVVRHPSKKKHRGAALVELCLVTFVLLLFMAGVVDLGRIFLQYFSVIRCGYEGARFASTLRDMPDGCDGSAADCGNSSPSDINQHKMVHDRIKTLLARRGISAQGVQVTTETLTVQMDTADPNDHGITKEINITVRVPYNSLFFLISSFNIKGRISAPYLYPDSPSSQP